MITNKIIETVVFILISIIALKAFLIKRQREKNAELNKNIIIENILLLK